MPLFRCEWVYGSARIKLFHVTQCYKSIQCSSILQFSLFKGDLIDTVRTAAEGVKNHSSSVATWMRNTVSPTLRTILPASPGPLHGEPQPSTSADMWAGRPVRNQFQRPDYLLQYIGFAFIKTFHLWILFYFFKIVERNSLDETFAAPSTTLAWKISKSGKLKTRKVLHFCIKVCGLWRVFKEKKSPKNKKEVIIYSLPFWWKIGKHAKQFFFFFFFSKSPRI